jgi:hypothetical protein
VFANCALCGQKRSFRRTLILARVAQAKGDNRTAIVRFERAATLQDALPYTEPLFWYYPSGNLLPQPCCRVAVTPRRSGSSSVCSAEHHPMAGRTTDWRNCISHAATPSRPVRPKLPLPEPGSATASFCRFQISKARASVSPKRSDAMLDHRVSGCTRG